MVTINYNRDDLVGPYGKTILKERYMQGMEASPQEVFKRAAEAYASTPDHAQRMYNYVSQNWMMFATPILVNGGTKRGEPISCYLSYVPDSREGLADHYVENIWLASSGGGIGSYVGHIRSYGTSTTHGSQSGGSIPFLKVDDSLMLAFNQGKSRRGSIALYSDIFHPEIVEFLDIRKPTGGDANRRSLNIHHAVNIPDSFMEIIERCSLDKDADDSWDLIDPHTKEVVRTVSAKALWEKIISNRLSTGEPFIHFTDTTARSQPDVHKTLGLKVHGSNLCSEITLPTGPDHIDKMRTAVCCLSSVNLEYFDEWKDTDMIADLTEFLDNVITAFVESDTKGMEDARYSASQERSLGIGAMGFHAYLQSKNIPFESGMAVSRGRSMIKHVKDRAVESSELLGGLRGVAPDFISANWRLAPLELTSQRRNVHLMAIAPNASSSIICGNTSPSMEPFAANTYKQKTLSGTYHARNKYLDVVLDKYYDEEAKEAIWKSINDHGGSVQHLGLLTKDEKDIFKTSFEIDQRWVVEHAAKRQEFICQAQSTNIFLNGDVDCRYAHIVHFNAWKEGLKTLYYMRSDSPDKVEDTNSVTTKFDYGNDSCLSCEG